MKQFFGKKSRSTLALVIMVSLILHIVAVVIFGTIKLVSSVLREPEIFEPATLDVAPQKEPEYQVNIQQRNQSTPPPRPPAIVVNNPSELNIPSLDIDVNIDSSSVYGRGGGGFGGGLSGVREMAISDLKLTDFGYSGRAPGTLEGTLIDLKRDKNGDPTNLNGMSQRVDAIRDFTDGTWTASRWTNKFYSAENKLYASYWIIGMGSASKAPRSFGVEGEIEPSGIVAYYEGSYVPQKDMRMRFCGAADDAIIVRLNSRIVFDGSRSNEYSKYDVTDDDRPYAPPIAGMNTKTAFGDWISLERGESYDLKILLAEVPGGSFGCMLYYQTKEDETMRVFSTKPFTTEEKKMLRDIHPDVAKGLE
ncbi:hypothetical protein DDZ13_08055 [Coraliomargarita sinensis]|uniref:PA14 domain-containing protein n=1 Tax=Coraliomargarita sinensis TaxID=2174842 RepID=A0A317ZF99_9BACT|nr:hypothetical protein [Coraliomargarita sinensis]PXA03990.1 hypothetical protein DDZ13_08055 [Coraliomargarita sinensis]